MAINVSGGGGPRSDINITPLVDVVLVLLIIFMVITPIVQLGYDVQVPPKLESVQPVALDADQVIVRMDREGLMYINKLQVPAGEFPGRLQQAMTGRSKKVVFFAADGELQYDRVADFMDLVRDNGAENLGIVFEDIGRNPGAAAAVGAR